MKIIKRQEHLKVLDDRYEDIEMYLQSIPDEEIRSALLFFVGEGIEDIICGMNSLKRDIDTLRDENDDLLTKSIKYDSIVDELDEAEEQLENFKEKTLDWEMAMETFHELKDKMNPWEFEKLIIKHYGNI